MAKNKRINLRSLFSKMFGSDRDTTPPTTATSFKIIGGDNVVWTPYNGDIFQDADVRACVDAIARNGAKMHPRHIRNNEEGIQNVRGNTYRLLAKRPNDLENAYQFYYQIIWELKYHNEAYVYVEKDENLKPLALYPLVYEKYARYEYKGKIYIESNGFCSLAGIGSEEGLPQKALDSVKEHLDTKYGVMILQPAYTRYHLELGEISSYPPGYKENAGIFCHNNPWISIAETTIGRGDRAFEVYRKTCPAYIEDISEIHRTEPYVYSQMVAGADAPRHGEAKNSWLTGTAAWTFVNISQYILGLYPTHSGLSIDPCVPKDFGDFTLTRKFREGTYHISVKNPNCVEKGVCKLVVDGSEINGTIIPYIPGKTEYNVEVFMGE